MMQDSDARISVVIVTRNRAASLLRTLDRLLALAERPRIVVMDNGSSDGSAERVRAQYPAVEIVALRENLGAAGRNVGVRQVHTPYVAFSDDDSWWAPGALAQAADLFDAYPRLALLAARVLVGAREELDPICPEMASSPLPKAADLPGPSILGFLACGAVVRRSAFLAVGGFPERFGVGGEEELVAIDLMTAGWGLAYVEEVVAHHHPSPVRDLEARRSVQLRNALWSTWLRRPALAALWRTLRLLRPLLRDRATRTGLGAALRGLGPILRGRRAVPLSVARALRLLDG